MHYHYNFIFPSSLSLSLRMERSHSGSFLSKAAVRADDGTCLSRPMKLCVFLTRHLFLLSFARGLLQLIGKNKSGKASIRRHAVIWAENEWMQQWLERDSGQRQRFACQFIPIVSQPMLKVSISAFRFF